MTRFCFSLLLFAAISLSSQAQYDYETALGVRAGFSQGLSVKHFLGHKDAIEGIGSFRYRGYQITGLYERHEQAFSVPHLYWYYGAGAHIGFWAYYDEHPWFDDGDSGTRFVVGVDGILGMEYNIQDIPINVSLDFKPAFNIIGFTNAVFDSGAFSIRYMLP